jgi:hypothetical protein
MICKLCLQDKPLLKKSHIAPNFLYKELKDEDNSFIKAKLDTVTSQKAYTGLFEPDILCQNCDNVVLGQLETYAYDVLYTGKIKGFSMKNEITPDGVEWVFCEGVDYRKFKLFLLSLLWRFSISSNDFYRFVDLGKHEETIRKMILNGDAGEVLEFPCSVNSYRKHTDLPFEIISQPMKHRHNNGICYSVIMGGLLYTFYVSNNLIPDYIGEIVVNKNNQLKVVQIPKDHAIKIIRKYMGLKNTQSA